MIVAAHQPNFIPWLGFFDKMRQADLFIIVDHVQFERQNYQNRARIKTGEGARWITVPVTQTSRDERIVDKRVDNSRSGRLRWQRKMFLTIKYAYQAAPFYADYAPALLEILDERWDMLGALNRRFIDFCREALGIRTPIVRSSELEIRGAKSDMVLDMCRQVGADAYLSGAGASKGYLDISAFESAGVRVLWQEFEHPRYVQHPGAETFVERLSALDMLFNCGAAARDLMHGPRAEAQTAQA